MDSTQPRILQFFDQCTVPLYSSSHPQQKATTHSILSDLITNCNFPLSIIDNKNFQHFLSIVDSKYTPVCRRTMTSKLEDLVSQRKLKLKAELKIDNVSVTVDR